MSERDAILDRISRLSHQQKAWLKSQVSQLDSLSEPTGPKELVAWFVSDSTVNDSSVREQLKQRLPDSLIPRRLIQTDSLPRTDSGKIDRKRLIKIRKKDAPSEVLQTPTSASELAVIDLCRDLLRVDDISPTDNFAALGGDSMRSIQFIAMARERGLQIEPQDIHQCATLAELARVAEERGRVPQQEHTEAVELNVVAEVRAGRRRGSILLVHEVGGRCHYAHHLAPIIGTDQTLYVTQQPERNRSPKSITQLAEGYVESWMTADPKGPYVVIAFCWGGLLGYEISRQMKARGIPPSRLIIIESGTEAAYAHAATIPRWIDFGRGLSVRVRNRFASLTNVASVTQLMRSLVRRLLRGTPKVTADSGFQFREEEGDPLQIRDNVQAFLDYRIEPAELPLDLFRVSKAAGLIGTRYSNRSFGWRYLVGDRLSITTVPGDHDTCMQPPNVEALAKEINHLLSRL